jgi:6-phosphogluconolactonase
MAKQSIPLERFQTADGVAARVASRIVSAAHEAIASRGRFSLVLAGGRTPIAAYERLALEFPRWDRWHFFFGDERCLPVDDSERNSLAAARALRNPAVTAGEGWHPIHAELGPEAAAARYASSIAGFLPFDLILLGMGEDGHTASLFPDREWLDDALVIPVRGSPKPPPERVSLAPRALAACREMLVLATGGSKHDALARWLAGVDLPVARIASLAPARVLVDQDAVSGLGEVREMPRWKP